jgi:hypothetical protein
MSGSYRKRLDEAPGVLMIVDYTTERGVMVDYSVVLVLESDSGPDTIRLYDGAHGFNEMHRYSSGGGKRSGEVFHRGTLSEGMQIAIEAIKTGYARMVEGWEGR